MSKHIVISCLLMMIFGTHAVDLEILHNNTRELLEKCFSDQLNPAVTTVDLVDIMFEVSINEIVNSSTVTIDKDFKPSVLKKHYPNHPTYLLSAEPDGQLSTILRKIKSTKIWNVASLVFVVGENCGNAEKVLRMTWGIEALTSFYVCNQENDTLVYTFNPYTSRAPKPWSQVTVEIKTDDNRWTLFRRKFTNDSKCHSFLFDKRQHLDGAPVTGMTFSPIKNTSIKEFVPEAFIMHSRDTHFIFDNIFSMINVTPVMHYLPLDSPVDVDKIVESFNIGSSDIWLDVEKLANNNYNYFDVISLYLEGGFTLITNKFNTIPILNQVVDSMFSFNTLVLSAIILISMFIMILVNNQYHFAETVLDMLLFILNMGLQTRLERLFMRITFLSASLFALMFNPALEGELMSLLTKPSHTNVENLEDLHNNQYNVYYDGFIQKDILLTGVWTQDSAKKYLHKKEDWYSHKCNDDILTKKTTACIFDYQYLLYGLKSDKHLAKNLLFKSYDVFKSRKHWALKKKLDEAAMRLVEAGFIDYKERSSWVRRMIKKKRRMDRLEATEGFFEQLDFENLEIAYIFLALCLVWAFFIFIVEVLSKKIIEYSDKRSRKRKLLRLRMQKMMAFIDRRIRNDFEEV